MLVSMGEGMLRTCAIFFLTLLFSMPLGMIVMFLRRSRFGIVRGITKIYIAIMRGTPLMLQLLAWYFGPYYIFGLSIRGYRFPAIIIGFAMNYAAYFAEIYRGGIEAIPKGQYEAAEVLGYSPVQTFFKIILPQVIKTILPSVTNEVITLVKDTSLARIISNKEIIMTANEYASKGLIWPLFSTALFFLVFVGVLTLLFGWFERKLDYFR